MSTAILRDDATHKRANRKIRAVVDHGQLQGFDNTQVLMDAMVREDIKDTIVEGGKNNEATHWWLLEMESGKRVVFFGTMETYAWFEKTGKGHTYQMFERQM